MSRVLGRNRGKPPVPSDGGTPPYRGNVQSQGSGVPSHASSTKNPGKGTVKSAGSGVPSYPSSSDGNVQRDANGCVDNNQRT